MDSTKTTFVEGPSILPADIAFMMAEAERIFGTQKDANQIAVTDENLAKLLTLHPAGFLSAKVGDDIVGWVVTVPTSHELAEDFLEKKITERELFERSTPQSQYSALYFSAVIVPKQHRRKGYATALVHEVKKRIPHTPHALMAYWAYSDDGRRLAEHMTKSSKVSS